MQGISYQSLYKRWEENNWSATSISFAEDKKSWAKLSEEAKTARLWLYAMFFTGEDAVADGLSSYIEAAPKEEQKYFLATQQVDEARHAVFFDRFFDEVIGVGSSIAERLSFAGDYLSWGHRQLFKKLEEVSASLWQDRSLENFARAIALYHMVIEGTVAQPGQHFIEDKLLPADNMLGFAEGMKNVSRDEQRHIAFGVICLKDLFHEDPACKEAVAELLEETMPYVAGILQEPKDKNYFSGMPFSQEYIFLWSSKSMERKWKEAGYPPEEMSPRIFPGASAEITKEQVLLLEKGVLGEEGRIIGADQATVEAMFHLLARRAIVQKNSFAVAWRFSDAPGAKLTFHPGHAEASFNGDTSDAAIVLETSWPTWVEVFRGEKNMLKEIARGQMRVSKGLGKLPLLKKALS